MRAHGTIGSNFRVTGISGTFNVAIADIAQVLRMLINVVRTHQYHTD
jgi:hypothetical protein